MATLPVIDEDVAKCLEDKKALGPVIDGKRKLSTSTLSPPLSLHSSYSTPSSGSRISSRSFSATHTSKVVEQIAIPDLLRSRDTYEFLGFSYPTAVILWDHFLSESASLGQDFLDFAVDHITYATVEDPDSDLDDWWHTMEIMGISKTLQDAIMMPEFKDLRCTGSLKYWLEEAVTMNWLWLVNLNEVLKAEQARIQRIKTRPKSGSISSLPSQDSPSSRKPLSSKSEEAQSMTLRGGAGDNQDTADDAPAELENHKMLWGASSKHSHNQFYDMSTGAIDLSAIAMKPGDFHGLTKLSYFTPQRETADRYATWLKHKIPIVNISIAQIAVPWKFIESLSTTYLWVGEKEKTFEKVVFKSRRGQELRETSLDGKSVMWDVRWVENKDLLIGHIASAVDKKYTKMKSYEEIEKSDCVVVEIDGKPTLSLQWVFRTHKAKDGFEKECRGKVWLHQCLTLNRSDESA